MSGPPATVPDTVMSGPPAYGYQFKGNGLPSPDELDQIKNEVYSQFPCVPDEEFF
jgi:hypothetical protein